MSNDLAVVEQGNNMQSYVYASASAFEMAQRMAQTLYKSQLVPKNFQGKENLPNCMIALEVSQRIGASPMMVMQNLYIVHGKPSWSSAFIVAAINSCGRFRPLRYDMKGKENTDGRTCIAWTVERGVEIPSDAGTLDKAKERGIPVLESPPVSIGLAKTEGWYGKNGSKWKTMPELMMRYRCATFFGRLYAPEILMGMRTDDEVIDIGKDQYKVLEPEESPVIDNINAQIEAEKAEKPTDHDPETGEVKEQPKKSEPGPNGLRKLNVALDASNKPIWTSFVNNVLAAIAGIGDTQTLAEYQMLYADDMKEMEEGAPTFHKKLMAGFTSRFQELQEIVEESA